MARLYSHAFALKTASKPAFSGKVFENFMGSADKCMDTERVVVLKIETNCHVKLSRGRVEFGDCLIFHAGSIRRILGLLKPTSLTWPGAMRAFLFEILIVQDEPRLSTFGHAAIQRFLRGFAIGRARRMPHAWSRSSLGGGIGRSA